MVDGSAALDGVFHALADPTRRRLVRLLSERERTVGELARPFSMSLAAVSKHIAVLERARLVRRRWEGREARCSLNAKPLKEAEMWIGKYRRFWSERLDALELMLESEAKKK
jgi:DNA-binding transcriptional ArsR family regulator